MPAYMSEFLHTKWYCLIFVLYNVQSLAKKKKLFLKFWSNSFLLPLINKIEISQITSGPFKILHTVSRLNKSECYSCENIPNKVSWNGPGRHQRIRGHDKGIGTEWKVLYASAQGWLIKTRPSEESMTDGKQKIVSFHTDVLNPFILLQVESINCLLKGSVMTKACDETKHFYSDHSQPGTCLLLSLHLLQAAWVDLFLTAQRWTYMLLFFWTEFRQTDDWTARSRYIIHKNIQEDPWNLPHSIKNLVESLQRFVDG